MGLGGGDNREDTCGADVITGDEGIEEVFAMGEAGLEIEVGVEVEVPGRSGVHIDGRVRKIHRAERRVGRQGDDAGVVLVFGIQRVVAAGDGMVVAKGDQGTQLELASWSTKLIFDDDRVFAVDHGNPFLYFNSFHMDDKSGEGIVAELCYERVACGINSAGIAGGGKIGTAGLEHYGFLRFGAQIPASR